MVMEYCKRIIKLKMDFFKKISQFINSLTKVNRSKSKHKLKSFIK